VADVSTQTIYATYGSKASVLAAIDIALVGDYDEIAVVDRAPGFEDMSRGRSAARFAAYAEFVRTVNERVAPMIRVMEQAAASDPALKELRSRLASTVQADCGHWNDQLGPKALRPGLSAAHAVDVMMTTISPYVYSMLTVDRVFTPDDYEQWQAHALPPLLLKPELLRE
jgi:AcrR family transcriptional regulator